MTWKRKQEKLLLNIGGGLKFKINSQKFFKCPFAYQIRRFFKIFDSKIKSLLIYFYYTQKPRLINPLSYVIKLNEFFAFNYIKKNDIFII